MLLEFRCANYKSIRAEVTFSALAGSGDTHPGSLFTVGRLRLLRSAVIFGANGSGKSNLLDALKCVRAWVLDAPDRPAQLPHKLSAGEPSQFCVQFLAGDTRYVFGLSLRGRTVAEEYLYYFPNGRQVKLYERDGQAVSAGDRLRGRLEPPAPDRLLLAASPAPELADARRFFTEILVPYRITAERDPMPAALAALRDSPATRRTVCALLASLGTGIIDLRVDDDAANAAVVYPDFTTDLLREESTGIRRLVAFLCPLVDMLRTGRVLLCDEPETHLHEAILRSLLGGLEQADRGVRSQLIFSTHNTSLLDPALLRRDQIWFTELRPADRSTDLYSLAEIRDVRQDEDLRQAYMLGKYGAVPLPGHALASLFDAGGGDARG